MIAGLVLAAGASRRFGRTKQLLPVADRLLIDWSLDAMRAASLSQLVLVLGHDATTIQASADLTDADIVINPQYALGMSTSLQRGLRAMRPDIDAAVVITCDQPFVTAEHLKGLIKAGGSPDFPIVATDYGAYQGVPMLLARQIWPLADEIVGDQGARVLLRLRPALASYVQSRDPAMALDVDTSENYQEVLRLVAARH